MHYETKLYLAGKACTLPHIFFVIGTAKSFLAPVALLSH